MTNAKTQAENVAETFGNDGQVWEGPNGVNLDDWCQLITGREPEWRDGYRTGDTYRHVFADGSAIVVSGDAWDVEGEEPFSWEGA
jgi:hypothetical protein